MVYTTATGIRLKEARFAGVLSGLLFWVIVLAFPPGTTEAFHILKADKKVIDTYIVDHFPDLRQVSTEQLQVMLEEPAEQVPIIIDARSAEEYRTSHLKNAVNIPKSKEAYLFLKNLNTDQPVIVYCSVGVRSSAMVNQLDLAGFANVYSLEGSIFKWANEGRPLYQGSVTTDKVHPFDEKWGVLLERQLWSILSE